MQGQVDFCGVAMNLWTQRAQVQQRLQQKQHDIVASSKLGCAVWNHDGASTEVVREEARNPANETSNSQRTRKTRNLPGGDNTFLHYTMVTPQLINTEATQQRDDPPVSPEILVRAYSPYGKHIAINSSITSTESIRKEEEYNAALMKHVNIAAEQSKVQQQKLQLQKEKSCSDHSIDSADVHQVTQITQLNDTAAAFIPSSISPLSSAYPKSPENEVCEDNKELFKCLQSGTSSSASHIDHLQAISYDLSGVLNSPRRNSTTGHHLTKQQTTTHNFSLDEEMSQLSTPSSHNNNSSPSASLLLQRLAGNDSLTKEQEMALFNYVRKRSVLQLVTEDLLNEKWMLVDFALIRLFDICCNEKSNQVDHIEANRATENRIRFIKAGGHALLVGVMKKFSHVAHIQTSACRLIQNFLLFDKEAAFSELLGAVDCIERVLAALQLFPPDANDQVHRFACSALTSLVCSSNKMIQRLMKRPGNLKIFLKAMNEGGKVNPETPRSCRVLYFVSTSAQYCKEIVSVGGLEEIAKEMKQHPSVCEVQGFGCGALANVIAATEEAAIAEHVVNQLGGAELIRSAMKNFPDVEKIQEKGTLAFAILLNHPKTQAPIKGASALSAIGAGLENFPQNTTIQEHGSTAIKLLLDAKK